MGEEKKFHFFSSPISTHRVKKGLPAHKNGDDSYPYGKNSYEEAFEDSLGFTSFSVRPL